MFNINGTIIKNDSYSFFGPVGMPFLNDGHALDETDSVKITISVCLVISMILSIVGNVCTCAVIARDRSMRTPTNCYLFNLAITDLLLALFIPMEIYLLWVPDFYPLGEEGCRIHFLLWDILSNTSTLTITAFTVERYLVISKPFLRQTLAKNSRVFKIVTVIWMISGSFTIPDIFYIDLLERKKYVYCYFTVSENLKKLVAVEMVVFFMMPMTIIITLYILIALKLKPVQLKLRSSPVTLKQNRDKAVKMLAAVAASFFFCWSPYCVMRLLMTSTEYTSHFDNYFQMWRYLNYLSYNGYVSTVINPILYSLMSRKFRQAFKDFFKGRNSSNRKRTVWTHSTTITDAIVLN